MNYDWLEDSKALNKGLLKPHCFYSLDPAYRQSLNGTWQFKSNSKVASPFNDDVQKLKWRNVEVPSYFEQEESAIDILDSENKTSSSKSLNSIYKKVFDCEFIQNGDKAILSFSAVRSTAYYWLNGEFLGFCRGNLTEIEIDVSEHIQRQKNELIVQIFSDQPNLDHWSFSGIIGDVLLYTLPENHIRDYHISTSWNEKDGAGLDLSVDLVGEANIEVKIYENNQAILIKDCFDNLSVKHLFLEPWSFENPKLYLLELSVTNQQNEVLQTISQFIGFRSIEIVDGLLYFNGKYLTLKGVNRDEYHDKLHHVIDEENMLLDIRMMKAANINVTSNTQHLLHRRWYELCDKYGLLVIDSTPPISDKTIDLEARCISNAKRMFHRSKNHACVIGWNLGNECVCSFSYDDTYHWLKSIEKNRLVIYAQNNPKGLSDVFAPTFMSFKELEDYHYSKPDKPLVLSAYGDLHGNSLGDLASYWNIINKFDCLQGGFIDGWIAPGIMNKAGYWNYKSIKQLKGVLLPDRTPHPTYYEIKKVFQGITFRIDKEENLIVFRNNNLFEPIVGVIEIRIWAAKKQLFFQRRNFELPAHSSELITYNLENYDFSESVFLDVKAFINNGEVAGEEQFTLHEKTFEVPITVKPLKFPYTISPNIIRPPTQIEIITEDLLANQMATLVPVLSEEYIDEGTLKIKLTCDSQCNFVRFGIKIHLPKIFSQVTYLGRGPHENYINRKTSALWGQYYTTPEKMIPSYIIPQESGYRSENEELTITDLHGNGFMFSSSQHFGFSYLPFSPQQLIPEGDGQSNKALLVESSEYFLCLDSYMSGIGTKNEDISDEFGNEPKTYEFTLYISSV